MQRLRMAIVVLVLAASMGCKTPQFYNPGRQVHDQAPPSYIPTAEEVVKHLNDSARHVKSLECNDDLSIQIRQGVQEFNVTAMMQYQKPRNFRLTAEKFSTSQADIGSNDQEFWFWLKQNNPPSLFHCSYSDFARMERCPLPVHPDWIAEALCLQELNPQAQYQVRKSGSNSLELISNATSAQGVPMQKIITVAHGGRNNGRIIGQRIRSQDGKELWTAEILEYQDMPGYSIPRTVVLRCPAERLEMKFRLNRCQVNRLDAAKPENLFRRPNIQGVQVVDLASLYRPTGIRRVRGQH